MGAAKSTIESGVDTSDNTTAIAELVPPYQPRKTIHDAYLSWEYSSLSEKRGFFDYPSSNFQSVDELLQALDKLAKQTNPFFFRGLSKDTYKIVSSAQRRWRSFRCRHCLGIKKSYSEYLSGLLWWMKSQDGILPHCAGNCLSDHQIWGYLQHYGCPTPFIDFSQSYMIALYMAIRGIVPGQREGISVYAVQEGGSKMEQGNDLMDLDYHLTDGSSNPGDAVEISEPIFAQKARYSEWSCHPFFVRELYRFWCPKLKLGRMEKQTGLFLFLNDEERPFEDMIKEKNNDRDENGNPRGNTLHPFKCFDIPAEMIPDLRMLLAKEGVSEEALDLTPCETEEKIKQALEEYEDLFLKAELRPITTR